MRIIKRKKAPQPAGTNQLAAGQGIYNFMIPFYGAGGTPRYTRKTALKTAAVLSLKYDKAQYYWALSCVNIVSILTS